MPNFILGIFCGIGLSTLAIITGKKLEIYINQPLPDKPPGPAEIISRKNPLDEILK